MMTLFDLSLVFIGVLTLGLIGMGLFRILPKSVRDKIENYHEQ